MNSQILCGGRDVPHDYGSVRVYHGDHGFCEMRTPFSHCILQIDFETTEILILEDNGDDRSHGTLGRADVWGEGTVIGLFTSVGDGVTQEFLVGGSCGLTSRASGLSGSSGGMGAVHCREGTSTVDSRSDGGVETSTVLSRDGRVVQDRDAAPTAPVFGSDTRVAVGIFGARIVDGVSYFFRDPFFLFNFEFGQSLEQMPFAVVVVDTLSKDEGSTID